MHLAKSYDVLIIGAGSAGIAAAVQAARCGMKTAIVERLNFAGGKATAAEVRTLCGFYFSGREKAEFLHKGFPREFAEEILETEQGSPQSFDKDLHFIPYEPNNFKRLAEKYLQENSVDIYFHSYPLSMRKNELGEIISASILNKNEILEFGCRAVIDCSGESVVSLFLNLPQIKEEYYQAPTQVFTLSGIDFEDDVPLNLVLNKVIMKAVSTGELTSDFDRLSLIPHSFRAGNASFKFTMAEKVKEIDNKHSNLELKAREKVAYLLAFLKQNVVEFENVELASMAIELGLRTGRRMQGKYVLSKSDIVNSRQFTDVVARGSWPIEKWGEEKRVSMSYPEFGDFYDIPLGALESAYCSNLFAAGRNISADTDAIASARVIGTCMATGAGIATYVAQKLKGASENEALNFLNRELLLNL